MIKRYENIQIIFSYITHPKIYTLSFENISPENICIYISALIAFLSSWFQHINIHSHQSRISLKRLLTKSAVGKHGCGPISRGMTKLGGECLNQSVSVAPFSSLSSAVSGRLRFLFITVPYRQSLSSPSLSLVLSISLALPTSLHSCMNQIPAVACRGIHSYTQPKGERERETG